MIETLKAILILLSCVAFTVVTAFFPIILAPLTVMVLFFCIREEFRREKA